MSLEYIIFTLKRNIKFDSTIYNRIFWPCKSLIILYEADYIVNKKNQLKGFSCIWETFFVQNSYFVIGQDVQHRLSSIPLIAN